MIGGIRRDGLHEIEEARTRSFGSLDLHRVVKGD